METDRRFNRYRELQSYVGWTEADAERIAAAAPLLEPHLVALIDDFYAEIERHPTLRKVITGGQAQIERLKGTLVRWLRDLFSGTYDADYVARRWRVGWRHVEIGLEQVYTNVALSRLRTGLIRSLQEAWQGDDPVLERDGPLAQQAARSRPGDHRGRLPGRVRGAAPAKRAAGDARAGRRRRRPRAPQSRSTWSRPRSTTCSTPATPRPRRKPSTCGGSSGTSTLADNVITALSNFAKDAGARLAPDRRRAAGARGARDQPAGRRDRGCARFRSPGFPTPWATPTSSGSRSAT